MTYLTHVPFLFITFLNYEILNFLKCTYWHDNAKSTDSQSGNTFAKC